LWLAGLISTVLGCGGCGLSASPSDPTEGRIALNTALDAWKRGEKPTTLSQRIPPIHVADVDWISGLRLRSYKAVDDGKLIGSDVNYKVVLELKLANGKVVKRDAVYAVTTRPQLLVLRQDSL
jgi:hypothetical protein